MNARVASDTQALLVMLRETSRVGTPWTDAQCQAVDILTRQAQAKLEDFNGMIPTKDGISAVCMDLDNTFYAWVFSPNERGNLVCNRPATPEELKYARRMIASQTV